MAEQDVAVVRRVYEALGAQDPDRALDQFHEDMEWTPPQDEPDSGTVHGKEAFLGFLLTWFSSFEDFRPEPIEYIDLGDWIVVPQLIKGRMRGSGAEIVLEETHVYRLEGGKIAEVHGYRTRDEAMKAAEPPR